MDEPRFKDDDPDPTPPPKAAGKGKPAASSGPAFRRDDKADANRRPIAILVGMLLLAGLVGVALSFFTFFVKPPQSRLLTVHIETYTNAGLGVADGAAADAADLAAALPAKTDVAANEVELGVLKGRFATEGELLKGKENDRNRLVVSVSGLGAVRDGKPYLLPADADPLDPKKWLALDDILSAFPDDPAARRLLLLDIMRPNADPFLGRPDDAAAAVEDQLTQRQAAGKLPCPVLVAASKGEVSLTAGRAGRSVFGLYLADGLRGAAAGADGGKPDEITVTGLEKYVAHRVERYAQTVHGRPQHPKLYTPTGFQNFTLVADVKPAPTVATAPTDPATPPPPPAPVEAYPASLKAHWVRWAGLRDGGAADRRPEAFARLTGRLLRAERAWAGTENAGNANGECAGAFAEWLEGEGKSRPGGPADDILPDVARVRLAARPAPEPPDDLRRAFEVYVNALADGKKADDVKEEAAAWKAKQATPEGVRLVWRRMGELTETDRKRAELKLKEMRRILAELVPEGSEPPVERELALFLIDRKYSVQEFYDYPAAGIAAWLRAEDALGRALAAGWADFRQHVAAMTAADDKRRAAAERLLTATSRDHERAAVGLFQEAAREFDAVTARRGRPRADRAVPGLLAAVLAHQSEAAAAGGDWAERWVEAAGLLDELLEGRADPVRLEQAVGEAATAGQRLAEFVSPPRLEGWEKKPKPWGGPDDIHSAAALVAGPVLPAEPRAKVFDLVRKELATRHDDARKVDADDLAKKLLPGPLSPTGGGGTSRLPVAAAERLLRLAGGDGPSAADKWLALGPRAAEDAKRNNWPAVARAVRVVPPAVAVGLTRDIPPVSALAGPATDDRREYGRWVRDQWARAFDIEMTGGQKLWDRIDTKDRALRRLLRRE